MNKQSMKRYLLFLSLVFALLTACEKGQEGNPWYDPDEPLPGQGDDPSSGGDEPGGAGASVLYNGIVLPDEWPPKTMVQASDAVMAVPWLDKMHPEVVKIDVGRQLFVDDFLISSTTLKREHHKPVKYSGQDCLNI